PGVVDLLRELEPVVAQNLDRHLGIAKEWHPHDYVPWSRGRDFAFLGGTDWTPEESPLDPVAKTAMVVNLLTEDNLPPYHQELATRVSHRNTGRATGCPIAEQLLSRIATDENLHMVFYRNVMAAALDIDADEAMEAIRDEVIGFAMPGAGMADFARSSVVIA